MPAAPASETILIHDIPGVLAIILAVPAIILFASSRPTIGRIFKFVPGLVFCYFLPTLLSTPWTLGDGTTVRVIPNASPVYAFIKGPVLLASLFLLTLNLDLKGIVRLGPKAIGMLLAGSLGVILGGPIAVRLWQSHLPAEGHLPLAYMAGSWIGGGPNAVALQRSFDVSDAAISPIIIVDAFISNLWLAVLLFLAARSKAIDKWLGADATAIESLTRRMEDYHDAVGRHASIGDIVAILALGLGASWISTIGVDWLLSGASADGSHASWFSSISAYISPTAWKVLCVTMLGMLASCTPLRRLEGAGASRFGGVMIYLLVACIGAGADFHKLGAAPGYLL
ncbi:MAG: DUF819 family protein, partial [Phycisphaerales bacterium]|nr:DUF819 family protein [Phycisphaerales bacterium]